MTASVRTRKESGEEKKSDGSSEDEDSLEDKRPRELVHNGGGVSRSNSSSSNEYQYRTNNVVVLGEAAALLAPITPGGTNQLLLSLESAANSGAMNRQECSESDAEVMYPPIGPEFTHEATGLNVMTHCVDCRSLIRPLLEAKARTRYCRVSYHELTEGFKGYCACHGRRDHGRTSGKRRMVFRKNNFSVADGWEPSHGAIAAYRSAKRVVAHGTKSEDDKSPSQNGGRILGSPKAPWGNKTASSSSQAEWTNMQAAAAAAHQKKQHQKAIKEPPAAWSFYNSMVVGGPMHIERCSPSVASWSDCVQPEVSIANFPPGAVCEALVVSVPLNAGGFRRATLLALPRFARSARCRFATLDAKEQLFYDLIDQGGPPGTGFLDATVTLVFSEPFPAITNEAAIRFMPTSASSSSGQRRHAPDNLEQPPPEKQRRMMQSDSPPLLVGGSSPPPNEVHRHRSRSRNSNSIVIADPGDFHHQGSSMMPPHASSSMGGHEALLLSVAAAAAAAAAATSATTGLFMQDPQQMTNRMPSSAHSHSSHSSHSSVASRNNINPGGALLGVLGHHPDSGDNYAMFQPSFQHQHQLQPPSDMRMLNEPPSHFAGMQQPQLLAPPPPLPLTFSPSSRSC